MSALKGKIITQVFRSSKDGDMYLYVEKAKGLDNVPEALMNLFGNATAVMVLVLDEQKQLARADAAKVMKGIREQGYYLQLPPAKEEEMQAIALANTKLQR